MRRSASGPSCASCWGVLLPAGTAELSELSEGDEVIGVSIDLVDRDTHYHWLLSFDADRGELRPGHVVAAAHIRSAIAAGRRHF